MLNSSRVARQIVKARRDAAKAHRAGLHTLAAHARLAGLDASTASAVGGALRAKTTVCGVAGHRARMVRVTAHGVRPVKGAKRYSSHDVATLAHAYSPRVPRLVAARAAMLAYAGV